MKAARTREEPVACRCHFILDRKGARRLELHELPSNQNGAAWNDTPPEQRQVVGVERPPVAPSDGIEPVGVRALNLDCDCYKT